MVVGELVKDVKDRDKESEFGCRGMTEAHRTISKRLSKTFIRGRTIQLAEFFMVSEFTIN